MEEKRSSIICMKGKQNLNSGRRSLVNKLVFDDNKYTVETVEYEGKTFRYRAFENIVYVENPVNIACQSMNIFVPECYYAGDTINGYSLKTAPVFFQNTVGGYMPGMPGRPKENESWSGNAIFHALIHGYVAACPGTRGLKDEKGKNIGVAPAHIVDLKAAVRYLKYNQERVPGNVDKIISNGTSAGGALSSLLGAAGNHPDYEVYLKEIGAADASDNIFAASCYCPITNLEHADMAYEWEFCDVEECEFSKQIKEMFPSYLNGLELMDGEKKLILDMEGNGSFKEFITRYVAESVQKELDSGSDLSEVTWITVQNGKVTFVDWDAYVEFRTRMKTTPAFDNAAMGTPENELFGSADIQYRHFTDFSWRHSKVAGALAEEQQIKMMNPMNYIRDEKAVKAKHYRIRHGAMDRDTSLAISAILSAALRMEGVKVDYHIPWGVPHAGDYDLEELFVWIDDM